MINLFRPRQWIKNLFVFAPLIFSGYLINISAVMNSIFAFIFFCLAASSVYIVNDINDVEKDKLHPKKCKRPIASGIVSPLKAKLIVIILYGLLLFSVFLNWELTAILIGYILINYAYSYYLKHQPVLDIFCIAIGFVLRTYAGAVVINVPISNWMLITVLSLSLYLAAIKREREILGTGSITRNSLKKYSLNLIKRYVEISASCTIIFYSLYIIEARPELVLTIPLILFGLFRYWYINETSDICESPTDAVLEDWPILVTVLIWGVVVISQLYLGVS